jgi:hypothetical protein
MNDKGLDYQLMTVAGSQLLDIPTVYARRILCDIFDRAFHRILGRHIGSIVRGRFSWLRVDVSPNIGFGNLGKILRLIVQDKYHLVAIESDVG